MEVFSRDEANDNKQKYDRTCELEAFDESKAGVKGFVDVGLQKFLVFL